MNMEEEPYGPSISPEQLAERLAQLNIQRELEDRHRLHEENGVMVAQYIENTIAPRRWFTIRAPQKVTLFGAIMGMTLSIFFILLAVYIHAMISDTNLGAA